MWALKEPETLQKDLAHSEHPVNNDIFNSSDKWATSDQFFSDFSGLSARIVAVVAVS